MKKTVLGALLIICLQAFFASAISMNPDSMETNTITDEERDHALSQVLESLLVIDSQQITEIDEDILEKHLKKIEQNVGKLENFSHTWEYMQYHPLDKLSTRKQQLIAQYMMPMLNNIWQQFYIDDAVESVNHEFILTLLKSFDIDYLRSIELGSLLDITSNSSSRGKGMLLLELLAVSCLVNVDQYTHKSPLFNESISYCEAEKKYDHTVLHQHIRINSCLNGYSSYSFCHTISSKVKENFQHEKHEL